MIERRADELTEGTHVITATVTDSRGQTSTDTQTIEVFRVAPPPPSADLRATVSGPTAVVVGGERTSVRLHVANDGPNVARRLHVELTLGAGLRASAPSALDAWTCTPSGTGLACDRSQLPSGASTTLDVPVETPSVGARTVRSLHVEIGSAVADPRTADNSDDDELTLDPAPPSGGGGTGGGGRWRWRWRRWHDDQPGRAVGRWRDLRADRAPARARRDKRVTFTTTPRRDPTRTYMFTTKGRVYAPPRCAAGVSTASAGGRCIARTARACDGSVTVTFKRRGSTVSLRDVRLRSGCTFVSKVTFSGRIPVIRGALRVFVRFDGNATLRPRSAPSQVVAAGPLRPQASRGG